MAMVTSTPQDPSGARSTRRPLSGASPSPVSPARASSRRQEKEDMRRLNERLANYIERARQLEKEKSGMRLLLEEKEESALSEVEHVRRLYESELADARNSLDATANERARLQIGLSRLQEEHRALTDRNQKNECELNAALGNGRSLEAALHTKEADYANLLSTNRRVEKENGELKTHVSSLEAALQKVSAQLNSEMLQRVDAENQIQTLNEKLNFQKHLGDQEMQEMRRRHESRVMDLDSGKQEEFEGKLADAMKQLREEHEAQIHQYKEELEKTFFTKLENAKQSAVKNSDFASSVRDELNESKLRLESQTLQISNLQKQNLASEARVQELEQVLDRERLINQHRASQKEQDMVHMRQQMQEQLEQYQNLLDLKLMLDMEINAYRNMLEGEEQRLNISPSGTPQSSISCSPAPPTRKSAAGKKRKHEAAGSRVSPGSKRSSRCGTITIEEIDQDGRYIKLKNYSEKDQSLGDWVLRKDCKASGLLFRIPAPCVLSPGQAMTIWAGGASGGQEQLDGLVLKSHESWGPFGHVRLALINTLNEEVSVFCRSCPQGKCSDPECDETLVTQRQRPDQDDGSCAVM